MTHGGSIVRRDGRTEEVAQATDAADRGPVGPRYLRDVRAAREKRVPAAHDPKRIAGFRAMQRDTAARSLKHSGFDSRLLRFQ